MCHALVVTNPKRKRGNGVFRVPRRAPPVRVEKPREPAAAGPTVGLPPLPIPILAAIGYTAKLA